MPSILLLNDLMRRREDFLDTQKVAEDHSVVVPVCVPARACKLLEQSHQCQSNEQCAVVLNSGVTSRVPLGTAKQGESCEVERCEAGQNCLGPVGQRTCYKLCRTAPSGSDCGSGQQCVTTMPLFQDPSIGVCVGASGQALPLLGSAKGSPRMTSCSQWSANLAH